MQRNGTTAYLEAYDDGDGVMPILGELGNFIEENKELFDTDINTNLIKDKLLAFNIPRCHLFYLYKNYMNFCMLSLLYRIATQLHYVLYPIHI